MDGWMGRMGEWMEWMGELMDDMGEWMDGLEGWVNRQVNEWMFWTWYFMQGGAELCNRI